MEAYIGVDERFGSGDEDINQRRFEQVISDNAALEPTEDRLSPDFTSLGQSMPIHRSRPGQGLILINMLIRWIIMLIRWQPGP
jgi:hypothetical protein